jgi:hypothetical protein
MSYKSDDYSSWFGTGNNPTGLILVTKNYPSLAMTTGYCLAQDYCLVLSSILKMKKKARLYGRLRGQLNVRQKKVLSRMFREGPEGFKGGFKCGKISEYYRHNPSDSDSRLAGFSDKRGIDKNRGA